MLYRYGTDKNGRLVKKAVVYTKSEHLISHANIDPDALQIINRLRDADYTAYIVGGAVRDLIVGNKPKDFDIVTDATPSKIKKIFRNSRIIGRRFRLVHVVFGEKIFEVSTFRSICDGSVGNSFGTIEEDVQRRDFSMNALYYDPVQEQVIDYVGGMRDIKKHVLRPVIPLDKIFTEDPVRMLRAIKYSATTNARMPGALRHKIRASASLLSQVSPSRLTEEMLKILNNSHASQIISEALKYDLYMHLQPAATAMIYESSSFERKYMESMRQLDLMNEAGGDARLGKKMVLMIRDFVESLTDWNQELQGKPSVSELYARTWAECRSFVLPMNPMRRELEYAVKASLKSLGLSIKLSEKEKEKDKEKTRSKSRKGKKEEKDSKDSKASKPKKGKKSKKQEK